MKPTPLSSVLADDLLLDRIGARLDTDDELGSMLLAVAHSADTPIPRPIVGRRVRRHRGLTVLAALGVAVSGATVAAAVELGPVPPDQASGVPHSRSLLPQGVAGPRHALPQRHAVPGSLRPSQRHPADRADIGQRYGRRTARGSPVD